MIPDLFPHLARLLEHAYDALTVKPERVLITPGNEVAWDGDCGQLYTNIAAITPMTRAKAQGNLRLCDMSTFHITIALGIVRCVSTLENTGDAPDPRVITSEAAQELIDARQLAEAIESWTETLPTLWRVISLSEWLPEGPMGGLSAGEWTLTLSVMRCATKESEDGGE